MEEAFNLLLHLKSFIIKISYKESVLKVMSNLLKLHFRTILKKKFYDTGLQCILSIVCQSVLDGSHQGTLTEGNGLVQLTSS